MKQRHVLDWASPDDHADLADVIFDAVRNGRSKYSQAQRVAWVPERRSGAEWLARLARQDIAIARDETAIVGLMSLELGGYVDFAFIRPVAQGTGLFRRLFAMIEVKACKQGESRLWVHASLMAEPAFAAVGFTVIERQIVQIGDQDFKRAMMEKRLP